MGRDKTKPDQNKTTNTIKLPGFRSTKINNKNKTMIQTVGFILSNPLLCSSAVPVAVGGGGGAGAVAQSVERATPGEQVPGSIPAVAALSLLVGSVSV